MSRKHFRGRRHVRAQWMVKVSRLKKRERKFSRDLILLQQFMSNGIVNEVQRALVALAEGLSKLIAPIARAAVEMSSSFPFPPEAKERFLKQLNEIKLKGALDE